MQPIMIKNNQRKLNALHVILDALVIAASYGLAYLMVIRLGKPEGTGTLPADVYFRALFVLIPAMLILYAVFHLYVPKRTQSRRAELANILKANAIGFLLVTAVLFAGRNFAVVGPYMRNFSFRMIAAFFTVNVILEDVLRLFIRIVLAQARREGYNQKNLLLVGYSAAAEGFIDRCIMNPEWGYKIYGILSDSRETGTDYRGIRVVGPISELEKRLSENDFDEIAVTLPLNLYPLLKPVVNICEKSGVHTKFIPDYQNVLPTIPYTEDLEGLPVINIRRVPLNNRFNAFIKRTGDVLGSLALIILFSPFALVTVIAIKVSSPGPVFYAQERVGLHNRVFRMYKFRSMRVQTEEEEKKGWTTKDDPRVTGVGKIIRRLNIDETPQFFNILKGDMSLVGPRPERPQFVEKFKEEIPRYMIKHQVRPGLTGWAQVNGLRGDTSISKRIEYDLYYIENWTAGLDIKILFETVFKGFRNAY